MIKFGELKYILNPWDPWCLMYCDPDGGGEGIEEVEQGKELLNTDKYDNLIVLGISKMSPEIEFYPGTIEIEVIKSINDLSPIGLLEHFRIHMGLNRDEFIESICKDI
jgi:hypothetical protein